MNTSLNLSLNATMDTTLNDDDQEESEELIPNFSPDDDELPSPVKEKKSKKSKKTFGSKTEEAAARARGKGKQQAPITPPNKQRKSILKNSKSKGDSDDANNSFDTAPDSNNGRVDRIRPLSERRPSAKTIAFDDSDCSDDSDEEEEEFVTTKKSADKKQTKLPGTKNNNNKKKPTAPPEDSDSYADSPSEGERAKRA